MNQSDLSTFSKYRKIAIFSTSNGLSSKKDRLGLIYYSVSALKNEILKFVNSGTLVDMVDSKQNDELNLVCIDDVKNVDYDAIIIMNHTSAFFAGTLPKSFYNALMFLNGFEGDVWWCYDTPAYFPLKTHIQLIQQYGKYSYKKYNALLNEKLSDSNFVKSMNEIDNRMKIISDISLEDVPEQLRNSTEYSRFKYNQAMNEGYVSSHLAKMIGTLYSSKNAYENKKYDICLAFNYDNYRFSLAKKYIDDESLDVVSLRHCAGNNLKCNTTTIDRIHNIEKYYDFLETNCYSSLIVTTRNHLKCLKPERFYGVFNSYTVGFIPIECDPQKLWIKNEKLKDFSYISSKDELCSKLKIIKDKNFFDSIIQLQRDEIQ